MERVILFWRHSVFLVFIDTCVSFNMINFNKDLTSIVTLTI